MDRGYEGGSGGGIMEKIKLSHGSGGELSNQLIKDIFLNKFNNPLLNQMNDSSVIRIGDMKVAFTTDSFVINPIIFPGGDIGKLSVCGTVNDLAMVGAKPIALSCGFIIEEGFDINTLKQIVESMAKTSKEAGVEFIAGDTKVVNKGGVDKIFINTSGIGIIDKEINISGNNAKVGDKVIISGNIGEHEIAVMLAREEYGIQSDVVSDAAPLNKLVEEILAITKDIHVLRDPTRGGVATILNEIAEQSGVEIQINEDWLPISNQVTGVCNILGLEPLYLANEGKLICIVPSEVAEDVLKVMKDNIYGVNSKIIGEVTTMHAGRLILETKGGGERIISKLIGDFLPRIC